MRRFGQEERGIYDEVRLRPIASDGYVPVGLHHWKTATLLCDSSKDVWRDAAKEWWNQTDIRATASDVVMVLRNYCRIPESILVANDLEHPATPEEMWPGIGDFWHVDLTQDLSDQVSHQETLTGDWRTAYHGTAISNVEQILRGGLRPATNQTQMMEGVYCEKSARRKGTLSYISHVPISGAHPMLWWGCVFELLVDRSRGKTVHGQWV